MTSTTMLYCLISLLAGSGLTFGLFKLGESKRQQKLKEDADRLLETARQQADNERSQILLKSKEAALASKAAVRISPNMSRSLLDAGPSVPSPTATPLASMVVTGAKPEASLRLLLVRLRFSF